MGKFTISADTVEELHQAYAELFGGAPAATAAAAPASSGKKGGSRKQAEAPAPVQPGAAPQPEAGAGQSPFGNGQAQPQPAQQQGFQPAQQQAPNGFQPQPQQGFQPEAAQFAGGAAGVVDRPAVHRVKEQLKVLGGQHGEAQVYAWAMQKGFGCPPSLGVDEFLTKTIHTIPDDQLDAVYRQAGGK